MYNINVILFTSLQSFKAHFSSQEILFPMANILHHGIDAMSIKDTSSYAAGLYVCAALKLQFGLIV